MRESTPHTAASASHSSPADAHHGPHIMSLSMLFGVGAALMALTVITLWLANYHLGAADIWVAMGIATLKATLVALFFMHLVYDKPFNQLVFLFPLAFVALFIGLTMMDSHEYEHEVEEARQAQQAPATP